jgi:hypothetical protein
MIDEPQQQQQLLRRRGAAAAQDLSQADVAAALAVQRGVTLLGALLASQAEAVQRAEADSEQSVLHARGGVEELRRQRADSPRALRRFAVALFTTLAIALLFLDWLHA